MHGTVSNRVKEQYKKYFVNIPPDWEQVIERIVGLTLQEVEVYIASEVRNRLEKAIK